MNAKPSSINHCHPSFDSLWDSFREALIAAYIDGKEFTYVVPCHMQGDLFHFRQATTHRQAMECIQIAVTNAIEHTLTMLRDQEGGAPDAQ